MSQRVGPGSTSSGACYSHKTPWVVFLEESMFKCNSDINKIEGFLTSMMAELLVSVYLEEWFFSNVLQNQDI